jgi:hypothetical protein
MKNGVFWDVTPMALVRTELSVELSTSLGISSQRPSVAAYS